MRKHLIRILQCLALRQRGVETCVATAGAVSARRRQLGARGLARVGRAGEWGAGCPPSFFHMPARAKSFVKYPLSPNPCPISRQ